MHMDMDMDMDMDMHVRTSSTEKRSREPMKKARERGKNGTARAVDSASVPSSLLTNEYCKECADESGGGGA
jgi:hypothetical protein